MAESVLVAGYDYDEFRELQDAGAASGIVCDRADSPAELIRLVQAKRYNCIFCDISILDSVPYIHAIRKIQVTPIIIGTIEEGGRLQQGVLAQFAKEVRSPAGPRHRKKADTRYRRASAFFGCSFSRSEQQIRKQTILIPDHRELRRCGCRDAKCFSV